LEKKKQGLNCRDIRCSNKGLKNRVTKFTKSKAGKKW